MIDEFPEMPSKRCSDCKQMKKIMHFARGLTGPHGKQSSCRNCCRAREKERKVANPAPADLKFNLGPKLPMEGSR